MAGAKMGSHKMTAGMLTALAEHLRAEERAENTIQKYVRYAGEFLAWLKGRAVSKETAVAWKEALQGERLAPATINAKITSVNAFFKFAGWDECRVRTLRLQRQVFRDPRRDLTGAEYARLVQAARDRGDERLALLMECICATGIRVSEVRYITVEAVAQGRAVIQLKGKIRTIILPGKLRKKLARYIQKKKLASGEVFLTRGGRGMSRRQIWAAMKGVCQAADVEPSKVFPHNLRHLFARTYYKIYHDIVKLADMLGHSNMETTRIYLVSTGQEHARQLDRLGLVS